MKRHSDYEIRSLHASDIDNGFLDVLKQLSPAPIDRDKAIITYKCYENDHLRCTFVVCLKYTSKVIGTASVFIEQKFSNNCGTAAHIEDVVVDEKYRGCGIGKELVKECLLFAKMHGTYKILLNCEFDRLNFYKQCGFYYNSFGLRQDFADGI